MPLASKSAKKRVPGNSDLIYESSNGDSWSLTRDPATGGRAVMHRPNPQSGGQVSFIGVEKFLADDTNGPEHQALERLMENTAGLPSILIAYDIHPPKGGRTRKPDRSHSVAGHLVAPPRNSLDCAVRSQTSRGP
jgi:hypothetical protein